MPFIGNLIWISHGEFIFDDISYKTYELYPDYIYLGNIADYLENYPDVSLCINYERQIVLRYLCRFSTYIKRDVDSRLWGLLFGFQLKFNKAGECALQQNTLP